MRRKDVNSVQDGDRGILNESPAIAIGSVVSVNPIIETTRSVAGLRPVIDTANMNSIDPIQAPPQEDLSVRWEKGPGAAKAVAAGRAPVRKRDVNHLPDGDRRVIADRTNESPRTSMKN